MADQPPAANRPSNTTPDDQPTLILPTFSYCESNKSSASVAAPEGKAPSKPHLIENPTIGVERSAEKRFSRLKKFCTSSPSRKVASAVGAIAIAALSGVAGSLAPSLFSSNSGSSTATQRILYAPWIYGDKLSPSLQVAHTIKGTCFTQSAGSMRYDAYRCINDNGILYDPCFSDDSQKFVACPIPSPADITLIRLEKPLPVPDKESPETQVTSSSGVWLVELADGTYCYRIAAASYSPGGMLLTYGCKDGNLYGQLNRGSEKWAIWEQKNSSADLAITSVVKAYT